MTAWAQSLPTDMRLEEKRLDFRSETNWALQNVRGAVGEALFNMLFDMIVERPDPMWYWKPEKKTMGRIAVIGPALSIRVMERVLGKARHEHCGHCQPL